MTAISETKHAGHFMVSEANGTRSRDVATVRNGQVLVAGQLVEWYNGVKRGELIAATGAGSTDGDLAAPLAGVIWDNVDASGGAVENCVYIRGHAEVKLDALTFPAETTDADQKQACINSLEDDLDIMAR